MDETSTFCRLCSENIFEDRICMFDEAARALNIFAIIVQHFGIEVQPDDAYSTCICRKCWGVTESFHHLYELVQRAEENLSCLDVVSQQNEVHMITVKDESECGEDPNGSNGSSILGAIDTRASMYDIQSEDEIKRGGKSELDDGLVLKTEINEDESSVSEEDCASDQSSVSRKRKVGRPKSKNSIQPSSIERKRKKERVEQENQQIRDFFSMNCEMCDLKFRTVNEASLHYKRKHNKAGYLTCCGKKFFRRCMALDHIQHHINPTQLKCELCDKTYSTSYLLRNHQLIHEQGPEPSFSCSICMLNFDNKMQLSQHMRRKHLFEEKKNFGCDICGKFFVTKRVLTTHIRGVHENAFAQMCHICARTFKSKHVYKQHLREHLEQDIPKLQCSICGSWLKNERGLRLHMIRHTETEVRCKICDKQTPNRHALGMHMRYVHSDAKHKCTICEKAFKKPIGLKEHMASHTGVDLYACPYCAKTFKSGANMHSHRKKEHFEQWTLDRHQRYTPQIMIPTPEIK